MIKESMRQAELNNWSLDAAQMADLCSSINQFFTATGASQHNQHGQHNQHNQHISTGNMYMDSRQNISSLMGPPGYPHMPPLSSTAPTMTGDSSIALLTGQEEPVEMQRIFTVCEQVYMQASVCLSVSEL
uniref:Forkhead box J3 n=1 Tax=Lates calcarifer TaxID=8187 RepID=A0A4W6G615_LATCA